MASEPSFMASVSRLGEATDPVSRWSRPMTIGAFTLPCFTSQLKRRPSSARSPYSSQQIRAGRPWKWTFSRAWAIHRVSGSFPGNVSSDGSVGDGDVGGVAGERSPAERAGAAAEQRANELGDEPRNLEGIDEAAAIRDLAP